MTRVFKPLMVVLLWLALWPGMALADSVAILVDNVPITQTQISQRAKLLQLERRGNSNSQRLTLAREELIDDTVQLAEAERRGIAISKSQVDNAFTSVARNLKMSPNKLTQVLNSNGVNTDTLRDRLEASLAWQQVVQAVVRSKVSLSNADLDQKAEAALDESESFDFLLKEVRFLVLDKSSVKKRTAEANQYRRSFQGCDTAVELSLSYTDAAVIDVGRRHATQMPDAIAEELLQLQVGGITKPRVIESGVSMLAVCTKTAARDLSFVKQKLQQQEGSDQMQTLAKEYLAELRQRANIVSQ